MGPFSRWRPGPRCSVVLLALCYSTTFAQTPGPGRCAASAVPTVVRAEGLTERTGDISLQCTGLTAGTFTGTLTLFLPVPITNRVDAANRTTEVSISANGTPIAATGQVAGQTITFAGLAVPVPAGGSVELRVSNLRAAVSQLGAASTAPVNAGISFGLPLDRAQVTVALPQRSMLVSRANAAIPCLGSELPRTLTLENLLAARTQAASTRVTEGYAGAFEVRSSTTETGTRVLLRFTGFPAGTQLVVPDFVAGADAVQPTRAGDLGGDPSVGQYQPGSGALLLSRVAGADATGALGVVQPAPAGSVSVVLNSVSTLTLSGGSGHLVYEVVDASPNAQQTAQIPVFLGIPAGGAGTIAYQQVSLAPLAGSNAIPRFADVALPEDCVRFGDCEVLVPKLSVELLPSQLRFTAFAGQPVNQDPGVIAARNIGGGLMVVSFRLEYLGNTAGWLQLDPPGPSTGKRVFIRTAGLAPGTYQANVIVDAGDAGTQTVPVTLVISPAPAPPPNPNPTPGPNPTPTPTPAVTVTRMLNGASMQAAPVVSGSLAVVVGSNFSGTPVSVTFEGIPARVLAASNTELKVRVPDLGSRKSALVVVTANGVSSAPHYASVATAWPAIFENGLLNQDNTVNSATNAAEAGSVVQVFATGLPFSNNGISVKIHDRENLVPLYSGAPPDSAVQQVNVRVPADLPAMTTFLEVCGIGDEGARFCSPGIPLTIRAAVR